MPIILGVNRLLPVRKLEFEGDDRLTASFITGHQALRRSTTARWINRYHSYPARAAPDGKKKSALGRETHKTALEHYQQTNNVLMSHSIAPLGFC